MQINFGTNFL